MKKITSIIVTLLCICSLAKTQTITQAWFRVSNKTKGFRAIDLVIDDKIQIGISNDRKIDYIESMSGEPYTLQDMENMDMRITYYDSFDIHDIAGRIKSIGNIKITYNNAFDIHDQRGSLKSIGDIQIKYYNTFDIHDPQGKIKSVGPVVIKYYNSFDPKHLFGNIKSIEGNTYRLRVSTGR